MYRCTTYDNLVENLANNKLEYDLTSLYQKDEHPINLRTRRDIHLDILNNLDKFCVAT